MRFPRLTAVRHAPTDVEGLCVGRTDVLPAMHPDDAVRVVEQFAEVQADVTWTSPLRRCRALAEALTNTADPIVDTRLLEMDFGSWEGRAWEEIEARDATAMARWMERWETEGPPGGESARVVARRVKRWWDELDRGSSHLLIAHAGVVRALYVVVDGIDWPEAMSREVPHLEPLPIGQQA